MSLAVLRSRALAGMEALPVSVEMHLDNGLPSFTMVGTNTPIRAPAWHLRRRFNTYSSSLLHA